MSTNSKTSARENGSCVCTTSTVPEITKTDISKFLIVKIIIYFPIFFQQLKYFLSIQKKSKIRANLSINSLRLN